MTSLGVIFNLKGKAYCGEINICSFTLWNLVDEVFSPMNRYATQVAYAVHEPTMSQLVSQYTNSGGFQRFLDRHSVSFSSVTSK